MQLINIPALKDNYIWLLRDHTQHCILVDPGEAQGVLNYLAKEHLIPDAILLTHHHYDHVDGVAELCAHYPSLAVYGPQETLAKGATIQVKGGDVLSLLNTHIEVIDVPGHTLGHVAYYKPVDDNILQVLPDSTAAHAIDSHLSTQQASACLFSGDTLFSAGCGRIFEGTPQQMYASINKLLLLPEQTLLCCAHEYTEENLKFAHELLPEDKEIATYLQQVSIKRRKCQSTLPSTLKYERLINVFTRCDDIDLQSKLGINTKSSTLATVFTELRHQKDIF